MKADILRGRWQTRKVFSESGERRKGGLLTSWLSGADRGVSPLKNRTFLDVKFYTRYLAQVRKVKEKLARMI